jgi:hypothetical protein
MTERKARAGTGGSRFLAGLGMTISFRNCRRKAKANTGILPLLQAQGLEDGVRLATATATAEADSQRE